MKDSAPQKHPDTICRSLYVSLARDFRRRSLDLKAIDRSATTLCQRINSRYYLKNIAFKPTGVALGCPLPDPQVTKRLWRLARMLEAFLVSLGSDHEKAFAFVPPDFYHITLVNRASYRKDAAITSISENEKETARKLIMQISGGQLVVHLNGLLMTTSGTVMVPGFPVDDRLYEMRRLLAQKMPELRNSLPVMAHIKLGHVLKPVKTGEYNRLYTFILSCGTHINARLTFSDFYTNVGRICFSG